MTCSSVYLCWLDPAWVNFKLEEEGEGHWGDQAAEYQQDANTHLWPTHKQAEYQQ